MPGMLFLLIVQSLFQFEAKESSVATKLENMENLENSGNLKTCQNLRENSGKLEFLWEKPRKLRENVKYVA